MFLPVPSQIGYIALAGLILGESAGLPLPGETALITAGGLVAAGRLALPIVILVGALAAIVGDTIGYWLGRRGGRAAAPRRPRSDAPPSRGRARRPLLRSVRGRDRVLRALGPGRADRRRRHGRRGADAVAAVRGGQRCRRVRLGRDDRDARGSRRADGRGLHGGRRARSRRDHGRDRLALAPAQPEHVAMRTCLALNEFVDTRGSRRLEV
jgi:hypothetical protein